jgi:hypothetical protein
MLVLGFGDAYSRLISSATETQTDSRPAFIPLFEVLNWTVTIDFRLQQDRADPEWWKQVPDGVLARAVRLARNRVHHQWANAIGGPIASRHPESVPRLTAFSLRPPHPYRQAAWRWRKELPPPETPSTRDPRGESSTPSTWRSAWCATRSIGYMRCSRCCLRSSKDRREAMRTERAASFTLRWAALRPCASPLQNPRERAARILGVAHLKACAAPRKPKPNQARTKVAHARAHGATGDSGRIAPDDVHLKAS